MLYEALAFMKSYSTRSKAAIPLSKQHSNNFQHFRCSTRKLSNKNNNDSFEGLNRSVHYLPSLFPEHHHNAHNMQELHDSKETVTCVSPQEANIMNDKAYPHAFVFLLFPWKWHFKNECHVRTDWPHLLHETTSFSQPFRSLSNKPDNLN